jgi:hypothetical protein
VRSYAARLLDPTARTLLVQFESTSERTVRFVSFWKSQYVDGREL